MMGRLDQREDGCRHAHFVAIEHGDTTGDIAGLLQPLDAPRAGREREVHFFGEVADREASILLQQRQNLPVSFVQHALLSLSNGACTKNLRHAMK